MSDFLSNLIERSFTDAPVIRPRVPSLFERTSVEFFDEQQSSTFAPVSELSSIQEATSAEFIARVPDQIKEHIPKSAASKPKGVPAEPASETKHLIAPLALSRGEEVRSTSTSKASKNFPKPSASQSLRRRDFSPVDQGSSKSPPIIRVTIGRVEVRAI
jgi:hypothetical protein